MQARDRQAAEAYLRRREDIARIQAYGELHPQCYGGVTGGERFAAYFIDPEVYRAPLRALLENPDDIDVLVAPRTQVQRDEMFTEVKQILAEHPDAARSWGCAISTVGVQLAGSALELAATLHERFGDAIEITLGWFHYPLDPRQPTHAPRFTTQPTSQRPGLELSVELDNNTAASGELFWGKLWALNTSAAAMTLHTDSNLNGALLSPDGSLLASGTQGSFGTGMMLTLDPGQRKSVGFGVGTESFDHRHGTTIPAGTYDLVVIVPLDTGNPRPQLVTSPVRVSVLSAPTHTPSRSPTNQT